MISLIEGMILILKFTERTYSTVLAEFFIRFPELFVSLISRSLLHYLVGPNFGD
jgi:hypothetical protein